MTDLMIGGRLPRLCKDKCTVDLCWINMKYVGKHLLVNRHLWSIKSNSSGKRDSSVMLSDLKS